MRKTQQPAGNLEELLVSPEWEARCHQHPAYRRLKQSFGDEGMAREVAWQ
jgi:hypothetical protein